MGLFDRFRKETRSIEDPQVPISDRAIIEFLNLGGLSDFGEPVTIDSALKVPSIWAAVNFLSGTIAGLPIHVFKRTKDSRERVNGQVADLLSNAVNDEMSSFDWLKYKFECVFTSGRGVTFIERNGNGSGTPINLWPLEVDRITFKYVNGRREYHYKENGRTIVYQARDVIDIPFMLKSDRLSFRSPIMSNADTVGLAQAATKYGGKFFSNGGVPPFAIEGPITTPAGLQRASNDLADAVKKASKDNRLALALPAGHTLKNLGIDPSKGQMVEMQRFLVEQIARIYSLPPTFLQDLTHGTFSNTEQQDLHFVKHTLKRWVEQFEKEINLKLFGRRSNVRFAEFNLDGLLRGDFKTRMEGYAQGIQNAVLKPNEARRLENYPDDGKGDQLMIQGATVPVGSQNEDDDGQE